MDERYELEEVQASFRGVGFHVIKRVRGGGRRGPTHQAPQRDEPDGEDLGRKLRSFKIDGIIIGDGDSDPARQSDCNRKTAALLAALEDHSGPGVYRDPWAGMWTAICRDVSQTDDDTRAFVSVFSISLEEFGGERYPAAALDSAGGLERSVVKLNDAARESFDRVFSLAARPQFVRVAAQSLVYGLLDDLDGLGLGQIDPLAAIGIADKAAALAALRARVPDLLDSGGFGGYLAQVFAAIGAAGVDRRSNLGDANAVRAGFAGLANWGTVFPAIAGATANRRAQGANQAALVDYTRRLALGQEVRAMAARRWESRDQALVERDGALSRLSAAAATAGAVGDDAVFSAVQGLSAALIADVAARTPLSRLRWTDVAVVEPACVLAYRLTGSGAGGDDLVARNGVVHPAFVTPGKLEYLDG